MLVMGLPKELLERARGLCKDCAPDMGVEMSAAQASRSVEEVWAHAAMAERTRSWARRTGGRRSGLRAPTVRLHLDANAKFCPECGAKLKGEFGVLIASQDTAHSQGYCPECGEDRIT